MPDLNAHISRKYLPSIGSLACCGLRDRSEARNPAGLAGAHDRSTIALIRRYARDAKTNRS